MSGAGGAVGRPMLVAVTRVRNEEDIVEAFIRHHATMVDHHVLLDDGSTDATPSILAALQREGVALSVLTDPCVWFDERSRNTALLRHAAGLGADWVLHLDCDEFVDQASLSAPLRAVMAAQPPTMPAVTAELVTYNPTDGDSPDELIVPVRIRHRAPLGSGVRKVFVRAALARHAGVQVLAGNHGLELDGQTAPLPELPGLYLAHYPMRSGWQMLAKATVGRLKVLATGAGESARGTSSHYTELVDHLMHRPDWVTDPRFLAGRLAPAEIGGGVVLQPLRYEGGALRHTPRNDPRRAALRSVLTYVETLARSHGALRDAGPRHAPVG